MSFGSRLLRLFLAMLGGILLLGVAAALVVALGPLYGVPLVGLLLMFYGWILYAFFQYRQGRQEEFVHLLSVAVESQVQLAPLLRSYVRDRPRGPLRELWVAVALFVVLPGYYWVWYRRRKFDRKVERVALLLEVGAPLPHALRDNPGVAPREIVLAAEVGVDTGRLVPCLRKAAHGRLAAVWMELLPRAAYPLLLLLAITFVVSFWCVYLLPRMQRIFSEFGQELPDATQRLGAVANVVNAYVAILGQVIFLAVIVGCALYLSSTVRWYFPFFGWFYRRLAISRVLKMLSVLLDAGKPVPESLGLLANSGYFAPTVCRRLDAARFRAEHGEELAECLRHARLLPANMVSLVQAAQRAGNQPWALSELGDGIANRTVRFLRGVTLVIFPVSVLAIGLLVGFIVVSMFLPLVELISRLAE